MQECWRFVSVEKHADGAGVASSSDDDALLGFEIQQTISVSITAVEDLQGSDEKPDVFEVPATNAELIGFCVFGLEKRGKALREMLAPEKVC